MDDRPTVVRSSGACSGHGGVRYWVYRKVEGDTLHLPTYRHRQHPQPLDAAERSELVQPKVKVMSRSAAAALTDPQVVVLQSPPTTAAPSYPAPYAWPPYRDRDDDDDRDSVLSWSEATAIGVASIMLYFIIRYVLSWVERNPHLMRYALRHLLRYRQRPPTGKDSRDPAPPRV